MLVTKSLTAKCEQNTNVKLVKLQDNWSDDSSYEIIGKRLTKGKNKRRVSFACRFAGMKGPMKKPNGEPTRKARALKKWGFGSEGAARKFCQANKEKK